MAENKYHQIKVLPSAVFFVMFGSKMFGFWKNYKNDLKLNETDLIWIILNRTCQTIEFILVKSRFRFGFMIKMLESCHKIEILVSSWEHNSSIFINFLFGQECTPLIFGNKVQKWNILKFYCHFWLFQTVKRTGKRKIDNV